MRLRQGGVKNVSKITLTFFTPPPFFVCKRLQTRSRSGLTLLMQIVYNWYMAKVKRMTKEELTQLREAVDLSQGELAGKIGYSQASVSRWETGERPIPERAAKLIHIMTFQPEVRTA